MTSIEGTNGHVADASRSRPRPFRRVTQELTKATGSAAAATIVGGAGVVWLILGFLTDQPRWWELIVTAGVPLVTLLMVVMLQHTQNHDARAIQLKLDELIRASQGAANSMMTVEEASADDLGRIYDDFRTQAESASPESA